MDVTVSRNGGSHFSSSHQHNFKMTTSSNNNNNANNNAHCQQFKSQRHLIPRFAKNNVQVANNKNSYNNNSNNGKNNGQNTKGSDNVAARSGQGTNHRPRRSSEASFVPKLSVDAIKESSDVSSLLRNLALGATAAGNNASGNDGGGNGAKHFRGGGGGRFGGTASRRRNCGGNSSNSDSNDDSSSSPPVSSSEYPPQLISWIKYADEVCGRDMREDVKAIFDEVGDAELDSIFEALAAFYSLEQTKTESARDYGARKRRAFEAYLRAKKSHRETNSDASSSATSDYALMDLDDEEEFPPLRSGGGGGGPLEPLTSLKTTTTTQQCSNDDENKRPASNCDSGVGIEEVLTEKESEELCSTFAKGLRREDARASMVFRRTLLPNESWEETLDEAARVDEELRTGNARARKRRRDGGGGGGGNVEVDELDLPPAEETRDWLAKLGMEDYGNHAETFTGSEGRKNFLFRATDFDKALDYSDPNAGKALVGGGGPLSAGVAVFSTTTRVSAGGGGGGGATTTTPRTAAAFGGKDSKRDADVRLVSYQGHSVGPLELRPLMVSKPSDIAASVASASPSLSDRNKLHLTGSPLQQQQYPPRLSQQLIYPHSPQLQQHHSRPYPQQRFDAYRGWQDSHHSNLPPFHQHFPFAQQRKYPFHLPPHPPPPHHPHHPHLQHYFLHQHQQQQQQQHRQQWPSSAHKQPRLQQPRSGKPVDVDSPTHMLQQQQKIVAAAAVAAGTTQCHRCGKPGHVAPNCLNVKVPSGVAVNGSVNSDKQCFHCYEFGHLAKACPLARDNYYFLRMEGN